MDTQQITTYVEAAPACWASYLINGDHSGLETDEINAADQWLASIAQEYPGFIHLSIDEGEAYCWHFNGLLTDVVDYQVVVKQ